ncbi:alpha/beta hydrolase [Yoonia sp. GPGPB17]|uniref:alpha/beta hydrolase n=1 Tax=Yoonia sp. GPGPB17 TaxID=3026147 RepID=UPI0030BCF76B
MYRQAQMATDAQMRGPQVTFAWPSDETVPAYVHDRDSVLHARQSFSDLLDVILDNWRGQIFVVAHSLGAFLVMETLVQRSLRGRDASVDLDGLALLQPDIALDVFSEQIRMIGKTPQVSHVVASVADPALRVSARVSQAAERVGSYTDESYYTDLGLRLIDVSSIQDARTPHLVAFSSPTFLSFLRQISNQTST